MRFQKPVLKSGLPWLAVLGLTALVAACGDADNGKGDEATPPRQETPQQGTEPYLPYSIRFNDDGTPVLVDEKGVMIQAEEKPFPLESTEIQNLQTMSAMKYKGSCKQVYYINGKYYVVNLPPQYCGG